MMRLPVLKRQTFLSLLLLSLLALLPWGAAGAQGDPPSPSPTATATATATSTHTATPTHTASPTASATATRQPITATGLQPLRIDGGREHTLLVNGSGFTSATVLRLVGVGTLQTLVSNETALQAQVPAWVAAGEYSLEVVDPVRGVATLAQTLTISAPPTPTSTPQPPLQIARFEPGLIQSGSSQLLSVFGRYFTEQTTIRIVGFGILETTLVSSDVLTATIPSTIPAGQYMVEVSDPQGGSQLFSNNPLTIIAPTLTPMPTLEPSPQPTPIPTQPPPTPIPGEPSLVARNFSVNPASIVPGGSTTLNFEVVNQGNYSALGVSAGVDPSGGFIPLGSANVTLPDIRPGSSTWVTLTVAASEDISPGPNTVPISLAYRDRNGGGYSSSAALSVNVVPVSESSQVVLSAYEVQPNPINPGELVQVSATLTNTGNRPAEQVLLRVTGGESLLLPGERGDSFPVGRLAAGESQTLSFAMILSAGASAGPQAQPLTISYLQEGNAVEYSSSLTVNVAALTATKPLLLLSAYDTGAASLQPGEEFTLQLTLQNVGDAPADSVLITYGSADSGGTDGGNTGTNSSTGAVFAPIGTGGTVFVGALAGGGSSINLTQDFIISGSANSGIYGLPINVQYRSSGEEEPQNTVLRASVVVVAPPSLQILLDSPVPPMVNAGEGFPLPLTLVNTGEKTVRLLRASVSAENAQVVDGAEVPLSSLPKDEDSSFVAFVVPDAEGPVSLNVTIYYTDDLNREQQIVQTYSTEAMPPPPPIEDFPPPVVETPQAPAPEEDEDFDVGRLLMGLLGLGS